MKGNATYQDFIMAINSLFEELEKTEKIDFEIWEDKPSKISGVKWALEKLSEKQGA